MIITITRRSTPGRIDPIQFSDSSLSNCGGHTRLPRIFSHVLSGIEVTKVDVHSVNSYKISRNPVGRIPISVRHDYIS
jgi:hypothetical protein